MSKAEVLMPTLLICPVLSSISCTQHDKKAVRDGSSQLFAPFLPQFSPRNLKNPE